ncbi:phosphoribosylglycinamide formyltransferase [Lysobacter yangpyeongensis]|uniref:Phosphoribosylglycinamide formyltransferase n=1 Tax=Lysobacter yangpyeongensis TaxID=346182 RepID=A0ABW0SLE4_9GAMM
MRVAVLASGRGSNLLAILDAIARGELAAQVVGVFSDKAQAPALAHARNCGIEARHVSPRDFASRAEFDERLFSLVDAVQPDLIVCAGYMRLISDSAVAARTGRMINIHPSLLPDFKGLHTHQQALDAGARRHGASVHFVTAELDGGPVIAQARVPVEADDDAAQLAARVLQREHPLLVATLRELAAGRVALIDHRVHFNGRALAAPLQLTADNRLVEESFA